jgi:hypothetical protein
MRYETQLDAFVASMSLNFCVVLERGLGAVARPAGALA